LGCSNPAAESTTLDSFHACNSKKTQREEQKNDTHNPHQIVKSWISNSYLPSGLRLSFTGGPLHIAGAAQHNKRPNQKSTAFSVDRR